MMAAARAVASAELSLKKKKKSIFGALFHRKKNKKKEKQVSKQNMIINANYCSCIFRPGTDPGAQEPGRYGSNEVPEIYLGVKNCILTPDFLERSIFLV